MATSITSGCMSSQFRLGGGGGSEWGSGSPSTNRSQEYRPTNKNRKIVKDINSDMPTCSSTDLTYRRVEVGNVIEFAKQSYEILEGGKVELRSAKQCQKIQEVGEKELL